MGRKASERAPALPVATKQRGRLAAAQADVAEIKAAKMRGELVAAAEVESEWSGVLRTVRAGMLAVPSRVSQRLPHLTADASALPGLPQIASAQAHPTRIFGEVTQDLVHGNGCLLRYESELHNVDQRVAMIESTLQQLANVMIVAARQDERLIAIERRVDRPEEDPRRQP
jgi:hypothetical protein